MAKRQALSVIEFTIVALVLAAVASVAIPRMSRGASAATDSSLVRTLGVLRSALDQYGQDHNGRYPSPQNAVRALTQYSNEAGTAFSTTPRPEHGIIFGPYLRAVPPLNVRCSRAGASGIGERDHPEVGWLYTVDQAGFAHLRANTGTSADSRGTLYSAY